MLEVEDGQNSNLILENMGIKLYKLASHDDKRGALRYFEFANFFEFEIKRYFFISDMPVGQIRGNHAHKKCYQVIHCVGPQIELTLENRGNKIVLTLDSSNGLILIPPRIWVTFKSLNSSAILAVFASELYDQEDYINDYNYFMNENHRND